MSNLEKWIDVSDKTTVVTGGGGVLRGALCHAFEERRDRY